MHEDADLRRCAGRMRAPRGAHTCAASGSTTCSAGCRRRRRAPAAALRRGGYSSTLTGRAIPTPKLSRFLVEELLDVGNAVFRQRCDVVARDRAVGVIDREHADVEGLVPVGGAEPVVPVGICRDSRGSAAGSRCVRCATRVTGLTAAAGSRTTDRRESPSPAVVSERVQRARSWMRDAPSTHSSTVSAQT